MQNLSRRDAMLAAVSLVTPLSLVRAADKPPVIASPTEAATISGPGMAEAASKLLASLKPELQKKMLFSFDDDERFNWHFIPLQDVKTKLPTRKGVPLEEMPAECRSAALEMVRAGTSPESFEVVKIIMSREAVIGEHEPSNRWFRRPGWYFVSMYGKPASTGKWGWRIEGHHLSLNFTIENGKCISATPAFYGMNPVTMKQGPMKGQRALGECEDLARALFVSLTPAQLKIAQKAEHFPEVEARTAHAPDEKAVGITGDQLTADQRPKLAAVIAHYVSRLPGDQAKIEQARIDAKGLDKVYFAYSGTGVAFDEHTYRITGSDFFIHYMNNQMDPLKNKANHIHSIFRTKSADFGGVPA